MKVIIVGCGRVGSVLAHQLYKRGDVVTVIDKDAAAFDNLSVDFQGRRIEGDVLSRSVLHRAEIEDTDALAAVTTSDSLNALLAHIARTEFHISKVVARNYDPRQLRLQEAFGIPVLGSATWGAQRIEDLLSGGPTRALFSESLANFTIYRLEVPENWKGRNLEELVPGDQCTVLGMTRNHQPLPISGAQIFETGDVIYLSADAENFKMLQHRLLDRQGRQV
jgi:trk system potassium uptake protein TrkA